MGDTLTLIDGQRMVSYPLSDDGERSFVDVSAITINAVLGIDVVKDGASALYGADAIAGVVNVKLKKSYVGSEFTAEVGSTQYGDGTTEHGAGIWGMGDLANDGYNVYVALDWHHTNKILGANRSGAFATTDWTSLPGGVNTQPGAVGASSLVYPDSVTGYLVNPATGAVSGFLPGCDQASQNANKCAFAFLGIIQSPTTQINLLSRFTKSLANDWTATNWRTARSTRTALSAVSSWSARPTSSDIARTSLSHDFGVGSAPSGADSVAGASGWAPPPLVA